MADIPPAGGVDTVSVATPNKLVAWLTSSTTILGASTLLGLLSAVLGGQMTWQAAVGPAVGAALAVAWPQLQAPTRTEIETAVTAIVDSRVPVKGMVASIPPFASSSLGKVPS